MKNDKIAISTPIHCNIFSLSPKISIAPTSTMTGLVALMGPTMVSGRCFIPKYPRIQELSTIMLFNIIHFCTSQPPAGATLNMLPSKVVPFDESTTRGRNIREQNSVFRKRTGITAFPLSDFFLNVS